MGGVVDAAPFQIVGVVARGSEAAGDEDDADGVVTFPKQVGDVVGVEVYAAGVVAQGRLQKLVGSHLLAVEEGLVLAETADVEACVVDVLSQLELLAQVAGCQHSMAFYLVVGVVAANPTGMPLTAVEEADFEVLHRTIEFHAPTIAVCHGGIHSPPAAVAALEGRAGVGDVEHLRGVDGLRVPQVALAAARLLLAASHDNAVAGLHDVVHTGLVIPTEARRGGGQRHTAVLHLDGEVGNLHLAAAGGEQKGKEDGYEAFHRAIGIKELCTLQDRQCARSGYRGTPWRWYQWELRV